MPIFRWRRGTDRGAAVGRAGFRPRVDALEDRSVPSNLVWANRGQADDRFAAVFGDKAEAARKVVDYCLSSWGRVIVNLNQPAVDASPDRNTLTFTVRMGTDDGFSGSASATKYAFPTAEDRDNNRNGYPTTGEVVLDAGRAGQPDRGWWIDPNPGDLTPFTNVLSPFAATRGAGSTGVDLVDIINGEIAHVLGLFSAPARIQTPLTGTISKVAPPVEDRHTSGGQSKAGFYYVFDGPSITQVLTSYDSGGGDTGSAIHTPQPKDTNLPIPFTSQFRGAVSLTGAVDAGNAEGGSRVIPSDNLMKLFKDAYGYEVLMPSTLPGGTFNASVTPTRRLVIRGGPDGDPAPTGDSAGGDEGGGGGGAGHGLGHSYHDTGPASPDRITLRRDGDDLVVTVIPGRAGAVENADPDAVGNGRPIVTRVPLASFDSIDLGAFGGDDAVILDLSGGDFLPDGGFMLDGGDGADGVSVVGGASQLSDGGRTLTVPGMGTVTLLSSTGPDPELLGAADTAVAVGGTVRVVGPDGAVRLTLIPFPGFAGGARATAADFNGDGVADVAAGTGPGGPSRVRVLDGATQRELFAFDPFEAGFTGGVWVAAGDVTGDGVPDLVVSPDVGGGPRVRVFSGKGFGQVADFFGIEDLNFRGGARAAVGDVTGDGTGDLIVAAGTGGGPRVAGYDGRTLGTATPVKLFPDFFAFEPALRDGVYVAAGDVTGDGQADFVAGAGPGGGPRVSVFDGAGLLAGRQTRAADYFAGDPATRSGARVAVKDLDGDGRADLVTAAPGRTSKYLGEDLAAGRTAGAAFGEFGADAGGVFVG